MRVGKAINNLGELERAVMDVVWSGADAGTASVSVRYVHDVLSADRSLAYTTVMTVMSRLADAGLLSKQRVGRAFEYAAAGSREELTADLLRDQFSDMADEDRRVAMLHFLGGASPDVLADFRAVIDELEGRGGLRRAQ